MEIVKGLAVNHLEEITLPTDVQAPLPMDMSFRFNTSEKPDFAH